MNLSFNSQKVFLGLGSNLGDSKNSILTACNQIQKLEGVSHFKLSQLYLTDPVSPYPQPQYLNAACVFNYSQKDPHVLLNELQKIERKVGKSDALILNGPRYIDIDILLFHHQFIDTETLRLPHPKMLERTFVIKPLSDLVDRVQYPLSNGSTHTIDLRQQLLLNDKA